MSRREFPRDIIQANHEILTAGLKRVVKTKNIRWLEDVLSYKTDECIDWPFSTRENGYGQIMVGRKRTTPHRIICTWVYGPPSDERMHAAHSCGNRICCNPSHLRWASATENAADKKAHGTYLYGESCPASRLTEYEVRHIRALLRGRDPLSAIARRFSVSVGTIWDIKAGKTWRDVA